MRTHPLKHFRHGGTVRQVQLLEGEAGPAFELGQSRLLQADIVIIVQVVHPMHLVAALKQALGEMESDESGCSGD